MVLVSNHALKTVRTAKMKALGMRVLSGRRVCTDTVRMAGLCQEDKIAKAVFIPSGLRGLRCMGLPPTRVKAFRTTIGRRALAWRSAAHECDPIHSCKVEPIVAWAEAVSDEQLDDAELHKAWSRQQRLVGMNPSWSRQSEWTCGRHYHVPYRASFITASGHEIDLRETFPMDVKA